MAACEESQKPAEGQPSDLLSLTECSSKVSEQNGAVDGTNIIIGSGETVAYLYSF